MKCEKKKRFEVEHLLVLSSLVHISSTLPSRGVLSAINGLQLPKQAPRSAVVGMGKKFS